VHWAAVFPQIWPIRRLSVRLVSKMSAFADATENAVPGTKVLNGSLVRNTGFFALQFQSGGVSVPAFQPSSGAL
jgi:hypothetical protein